MKTIYMVKKDATKTYSEDNWILMSPKEFRVFRQNTDCTGRYFVQLDVCEFGEDRIIAECEKKEAQRYHAELVERMRNIQARKNRDIKVFPFDVAYEDGEELNGEDAIIDESCNVVEEVIMKMTLDTLQNALCSLSEEEYDLIDSIFLSRIETEKTYAKKNGYSQSTIHYRKQQILDKLKKFF